jgi:general secretion pathway protein J
MPPRRRPHPFSSFAPRTRRHDAGLTLIELMVALALLGVIGLLTWRATSQLVDARARIGSELAHWQAVVHASALIERELLQIAPPELAEGRQPQALRALELESASDGRRSRLAWTVIGGEQGFGRVEIRHQDRRLDALVWPDREALGEPIRLPLLDEVDALHWRLFAAGQAHSQWPATGERQRNRGATAAPLPDAVEFTMELADVGPVTRVFALR